LLGVSGEGVAEAYAVFYRRHHGAVLAYLSSRVRDTQTVLDLASEVFAAAYVDRHGYEAARGSGRAWLFGIANHQVLNHRRRGESEWAARRRLGVPRIEYTDAALEQAEALIDASRASYLEGLTDDERAAVVARVLEDQSYAAIADRANVSPAAARKRVSRGLAKLARGSALDLAGAD
jgi:RNA polymerase sigma factor (sigma-70 family)